MESIEKCSKGHTEKIIFRVRGDMKAFVKEFSGKMGMDTSDFMRTVLTYYFMAYFSRTGSYKEIRDKFFALHPIDEKESVPKIKYRKEWRKKNGG